MLTKFQTRKIIIFFLWALGAVVVLFLIFSLKGKVKTEKSFPSPTVNLFTRVTPTPGQIIVSAGYSLTCQITINTSVKKIYLQKLDRCDKPLTYKISPAGNFLAYTSSGKQSTKFFVYSLENNIEVVLDELSAPIVDFQFNKLNNLIVLSREFFSYYFVPLLFASYPDNFNVAKIETELPKFNKPYALLVVKETRVDIVSADKQVLYSAIFSDLEARLTPTQAIGINRLSLNWAKRIFFVSDNQFQTMDIDGENVIVHRFICDGKEVTPFKFSENFFTRSPDGKLLVLVTPEDNQIAFYDFVKDQCEKTGLKQARDYRENFSFSPDGNYLAFVDNGVFLYLLSKKTTHQLSFHNPKSFANPSSVTGSLVWSGDSQFIYVAVSKIDGGKPTLTSLKRVYFNNRYEGAEQEVVTVPFGSLYAASPDGSRVVYQKDNTIYIYDINRRVNTFFQAGPVTKLVWLRRGTIIAKNYSFQIDYDGENLLFSDDQYLKVLDLNTSKDKKFKDGKTPKGMPLVFFY